MDWIGLDLSQNITPPGAPCGANKGLKATNAIATKKKLPKLSVFNGAKIELSRYIDGSINQILLHLQLNPVNNGGTELLYK